MNDRNPVALWKLHAGLLAASAAGTAVTSGAYALVGAGGAPPSVVLSVAAIGFAIYAVLASAFVAVLGPAATRRKVAMASVFALVLAPIATASVLTMRTEKPGNPPAGQAGPSERAEPKPGTSRP